MRPRWETGLAVLAIAAPACAVRHHHEVVVIIQRDEPLRGYATGPLSLGESPSDLSAAQINRALEGHGTWLDSAEHGRIWRPHEALVAGTFTPYGSAGQWVATDVGWFWQSDYAWGRVPFHYGRWVLDGSLWSWVPGSQFAPAWVDWRVGGGWVAWAPLAPIGSLRRAPFVYCTVAGLNGPGLDGRLVRGPAASSLYARTAAVVAEGVVPRGPAARASEGARVAVTQVWNARPDAATLARPVGVMASVEGVDSVAPIPVTLIREAPPVVEPPAGGVAVVIRERDLVGMAVGPSVRRPEGSTPILPGPVSRTRPGVPVIAPPPPPARVASAVPPPLPPPPDGVAAGPYPGAYAARSPMAFGVGRARGDAPSCAEPPGTPAPPPQPVVRSVAQPRPVLTTGRWLGPTASDQPAAPSAVGPLTRVQ